MMDNVQEVFYFNNIPSSQTFRSVVMSALQNAEKQDIQNNDFAICFVLL
jgi:hypothetical protein